MIPYKLGDIWEPKIQVTIGKITCYAILDLGVFAIPKTLYDTLNISPMENATLI